MNQILQISGIAKTETVRQNETRLTQPTGKMSRETPEKCYTDRKIIMDTTSQLYTSLIRYLNSLIGRNLSNHTAIGYRTDLLQFLIWLTENDINVTSPEKITRTHILDYLSHLAGLGRSSVTRTRKLAAIREYCKFLVNEQLISSSSTENIVRPKLERKQRVFLRVDEYMRLLNAAAGNSRDYAILQLFLQTGIRVAVLVGLARY